ncbi:unnamed protein product [Symbiodinium sp. CCMP2592]|nr:unnamed protein product [Symbiodinium sp. CCMP2592]
MEHVEQAVAKALGQVVQTGLAGVSSHSQAIAAKMASWKKGILDEGARQLAATDAQINEAVQRAEATVGGLLRLARSLYERDRPKTEDEIVAAMMLQVEQHMETLALSGSAGAAGTGGTIQTSPMDVCPASEDTLKEMMQYGLLLQRADGTYETPDEQDRRLAHNMRMRFNRSFDSPLCPQPVLEAAKGLFEEWVQAAENWDNSSIVFNAKLSKTQRRRGKYVMKTFRDLKALYGSASAKAIREKKKELGSEWWWPHPEMGESEDIDVEAEWECFKVYDSMEFEDDETSTQEHSFRAEGTLDADATRALVGSYHQPGAPASSSYSVIPVPAKMPPAPPATPGAGGQAPEQVPGKGKSKGKTSLRKAATTKLSQISSKLTEARVLAAELPAATQMPLSLRRSDYQELI